MGFLAKLNCVPTYAPPKDKEIFRKEMDGLLLDKYQGAVDDILINVCWRLWISPHINWDGRLVGCCFNFFGDYGNVFKDGLQKCLKSVLL